MKYIVVIILLLVLYISYLSLGERLLKEQISPPQPIKDIPKVEIIKEFEFSISKDRYNNILFSGDFNSTDDAKEIVSTLGECEIVSKIVLDKSLIDNIKVIEYTKKIIKKLQNKDVLEWSIVYKDKKLLIEGKSFNREIIKDIDTTLLLSNINYFNNIKLADNKTTAIELLKSTLQTTSSNREEDIDKDTAEEIISSLREVVGGIGEKESIKERNSNKKRISKTKPNPKKENPKRENIKKDLILKEIAKKHHFKYKDSIKVDESRIDKKDSDIMSLPDVKFVEKEEPLNITKHAIDEGTVYIPPSNPDEIEPKDIPWAKLHDLDEKTDGILILEPINKKE